MRGWQLARRSIGLSSRLEQKACSKNLAGGNLSRPFCEGKGDPYELQVKLNRRLMTFEAPVPVWFMV
jgi:hypothetical protein